MELEQNNQLFVIRIRFELHVDTNVKSFDSQHHTLFCHYTEELCLCFGVERILHLI